MDAFDIELFFDGECPLCAREVKMLQRLDRKGQRIQFTDIAAPGFDAAAVGLPQDQLMKEIHGRLSDGSWITGVEVFRRLYSAVGFGPVVAVTRVPGVSQALDFAYGVFAKNRLRLTGRCESDACEVARKPT